MGYRDIVGVVVPAATLIVEALNAPWYAVFEGLSSTGTGLYGVGRQKDSVVQHKIAETDKFLLTLHDISPEAKQRATLG
jgi:hypothetical protein